MLYLAVWYILTDIAEMLAASVLRAILGQYDPDERRSASARLHSATSQRKAVLLSSP
jgi:prophage antirepressor-like protein